MGIPENAHTKDCLAMGFALVGDAVAEERGKEVFREVLKLEAFA